MTLVLAIDPGSEQSAWLWWSITANRPIDFGITPNEDLLAAWRAGDWAHTVVVIEKVESYGMAVGREVFATVHWSGRFTEVFRASTVIQMPRREVKMELCGNNTAKDANIRAALIDRFGGEGYAKGTKKAPGPLYGISKDVWSALAIAVTYTARKDPSHAN